MLGSAFYTVLCMVPLLLVYFVVIKPLIPLLKLKIKLGKKAKLYFFPVFGISYFLNKSLK